MNNFTKNLHLERLKHTPVDIINYGTLDSVVETVLNVHAPIKEKYDRANDRPFMAKTLRKAIMLRSSLRNKYNKNKTEENERTFKKQRNWCVQVLRNIKSNYTFFIRNNFISVLVLDSLKFKKL